MVKLYRRRYIAFELNPPLSISIRGVAAMFTNSVIEIYGQEDLEQYHIRIIRYDTETGQGIVRCDHKAVKPLLSALKKSTKSFNRCSVKTLATSGSIKALRRKVQF